MHVAPAWKTVFWSPTLSRRASLVAGWLLAGAATTPAGEVTAHSLAAHSGPAGSTMFTLMAPEQTGIITRNDYADPGMWAERYQELAYGAMGTGVAMGDYDNDSRPDVFVISKTETCRLFRNLGNWKFEDVTTGAGLGGASGTWSRVKGWMGLGDELGDTPEAWKQGAVFADINNDGWLDLYVCRFNAPNWLFVNQGDGTFREEAAARALAIVDGSSMAAFADYDRDGWLDVYVQTNMWNVAAHPHGRADYLLRNRADGTFEDVTAAAGITGETSGHSVTWWDFDDDGWPDIYVANDFAVPDRLYRNNRDGTFTDVLPDVVPHTAYYAMGADLGDVDNDGRLDLLVADMAPATPERDQRGMAGSRSRAQLYDDASPAPQYMRNVLFLNTGLGRMQEAAYLAGLAATGWTWSVRFEDLDNDGRLDVHVTNGMTREYHNADLLGRIMGAEDFAQPRRIVRESPVMAEANFAFRQAGDLQFEDVSVTWGLNQTGVSFGAAFGDLDGDGDLDLVFGNYEAGATVLRNDSPGGHRVLVALRGTRSNRFGLGAIVRVRTATGEQARPLVAARGYQSGSDAVAHFGLGAESHIERLTVEWPSGQKQVIEDLAADRRYVIAEPAGLPSSPEMTAPPPPRLFVPMPSAPAPGNITRVPPWTGNDAQPLLPWRLDGRAPPVELGGLTDVPLPPNTGAVAATDFDRDGHLEVFVGARMRPGEYPLSPRSALFARRNGAWVDVTEEFAPGLREVGMVTAAATSDVDGDGWPDLVIALDWGGVRYWRNRDGRAFEDWSERAGFDTAGTGWWAALAAADLNGDGRPDFVAGNAGGNTPYTASPEQPALILYGDFRGGSGAQLIEARHDGNRLVPRRTRNDLGAVLPAVLRRYPKNDDYARASLEEILGAERLARARRFAATELRSGIVLSERDGTYRFSPLPPLAQIAPLTALAIGDVDGDGHADIVALQNSHAPISFVGRFDGGVGLLLRGDGTGRFVAVPAAKSGIVIPGEGEKVELRDLDGDGRLDLVARVRGRAPVVLRRTGATLTD